MFEGTSEIWCLDAGAPPCFLEGSLDAAQLDALREMMLTVYSSAKPSREDHSGGGSQGATFSKIAVIP
jgi:hypothetical protein